MRSSKYIAAAVLPGLMGSPLVAAANPAASLSLTGTAVQAEAPTPAPAAAAASGSFLSTPMLIGGLALIAVVVGAVALGSNHRDSTPASA